MRTVRKSSARSSCRSRPTRRRKRGTAAERVSRAYLQGIDGRMADPRKPTINTYVSDMLALEKHILQPLDHQAKDDAVANLSDAQTLISQACALTQTHI